jgi:hypothetical protein
MDGVAPLTQSAIPAGGNFTYDFAVPDRHQKDREDHSRLAIVPRPLVD